MPGGGRERAERDRGLSAELADLVRKLRPAEFWEWVEDTGQSDTDVERVLWWLEHGHAYFERPVPVRKFLTSKAYMRALDESGRPVLWPELIRAVEECCRGHYIESVWTGPIGTGKTSGALYVLAYKLYELLCLKNPHLYFGLDPSSEIVLLFQSLTKEKARDLDYARFREMLDRAPIFSDVHFKYDRELRSYMRFAKRIEVRPYAGQSTAVLGLNVLGGMLDETDAMQVVRRSARTRDREDYDQALSLYKGIARRRESRFMDHGNVPGMLCLVSQKGYPGAFSDQKEKEARDKPDRIFVYNKKLWEVAPWKFGSRRFRVFVGDATRKPRVLSPKEKVARRDRRLVVPVPVEYEDKFRGPELLDSIREIVGHSVISTDPFIVDREAVAACFGRRPHVLSQEECDFEATRVQIYPRRWRGSERFPRYAHVDLARSRDRAGIAIAHVPRFVPMRRTATTIEVWPLVRYDALLRVHPPAGGEINFEKIRRLLYLLREHGLPIRWVSCDSYQSTDMLQLLASKGFEVGEESVDKTLAPYETLKTAIYDGRVEAPEHPWAAHELVHLERTEDGKRVDHPEHGCFTAETRVALLDGTCPTMAELARRKSFWVYSVGENGIQAVEARNARVTKWVDEVLEVTLDNYAVVRCTPDHRWMLLDGSWVEARDLEQSMSLMPLYRYAEWKGGVAGYERIWCPRRRERVLTHHLVAGAPERGSIVHHVNGNKRDNRPENLEHLTRSEHLALHGRELWGMRRAAMRAGHRRYVESGGSEVSRRVMTRNNAEGKMRPRRAPSQQNHRVLSVRRERLEFPELVYDLTVPGTENFALASGVFVHNSKDVADAMAAAAFGLSMQASIWAQHGVDLRDVPPTLAQLAETAETERGVDGKL